MQNLTWSDAIRQVLSTATEPLHYTDIAQAIVDGELRTRVGATPANTVAAQLGFIKDEVTKVDRGTYVLTSRLDEFQIAEPEVDAVSLHRQNQTTSSQLSTPLISQSTNNSDDDMPDGIINAFGMFWRRDEVDWEPSSPKRYGTQMSGSNKVDFADQVGIYILYQGDRTVYVGRAVEKSLMTRLRAHTRDRLTARWDRFSWFGLRPVDEYGKLRPYNPALVTTETIVTTMEAVLIEGLEPPQNRRRGDKIENNEFIQAKDPVVEERNQKAAIMALMSK